MAGTPRRSSTLQQHVVAGANGNEPVLEMRIYSAEELDVMAKAYLKALDKLPVASSTTALTRRLVREIGAGVANGIRDQDALAAAALERSMLCLLDSCSLQRQTTVS